MLFRRPWNGRVLSAVAVTAACLAPLSGAAPAMAAASHDAATSYDPVGVYILAIAPDDGTAAPLAASTLLCGPDGGAHAGAATACAQLRRAQGRVDRVPADPGPCTQEYAPVRVTATGTWNRRHHEFTRTYENRCLAVRATGGVLFDF
jgi:hypothetical protein